MRSTGIFSEFPHPLTWEMNKANVALVSNALFAPLLRLSHIWDPVLPLLVCYAENIFETEQTSQFTGKIQSRSHSFWARCSTQELNMWLFLNLSQDLPQRPFLKNIDLPKWYRDLAGLQACGAGPRGQRKDCTPVLCKQHQAEALAFVISSPVSAHCYLQVTLEAAL